MSEAQALLKACDSAIIAPVAVGAFAGLRRAEIERLDWSQIDLERGFIEVSAAKSKTAQRRLVTIEPNLAAWLSPHRREDGPVCPPDTIYRPRFAKALQAGKIDTWPANALRHSFASYHLTYWQDAAKTALQLGHTESRMRG